MVRSYTIFFFLSMLGGFLVSCKKGSEPKPIPGPVIVAFSPQSGYSNLAVIIKGLHFGSTPSNTAVFFNGVRAVVTDVTDTTITTVVPSGARTGRITVTVNGKTAVSAGDFVVLRGRWTKKAEKEKPGVFLGRVIAAGFSIGNKGYLFGGASLGHTEKDFWEYDPASNTWMEKPNPGIFMEYAISMVINNRAYVGIGTNRESGLNTPTNELWEYNPAANSWIRKADFPGMLRYGAIGFGLGNKGYAGLGRVPNGAGLTDWWEYDPVLDRWTRKADNPIGGNIPFFNAAGFVLSGKIYLGTGQHDNRNSWWEYNPQADTWTRKADFPGKPLFGPSGFAVGSRGYVAGGGDECWEYNATTNTWIQLPFFESRVYGSAFSIGNKGYYTSGSTGIFQKDVWEFDPEF
jgi:N-acetylneuraminic acid mutarotase